MREIRVSSTLTVCHDDRFWVEMFERVESGRLSACRIVFSTEPSAEEILRLICERWNSLRFTEPIAHERMPKTSLNPKRRQREALRNTEERGPSTKARQALSKERETSAQQRKVDARERRGQEGRERLRRRRERRRRKHRGR